MKDQVVALEIYMKDQVVALGNYMQDQGLSPTIICRMLVVFVKLALKSMMWLLALVRNTRIWPLVWQEKIMIGVWLIVTERLWVARSIPYAMYSMWSFG